MKLAALVVALWTLSACGSTDAPQSPPTDAGTDTSVACSQTAGACLYGGDPGTPWSCVTGAAPSGFCSQGSGNLWCCSRGVATDSAADTLTASQDTRQDSATADTTPPDTAVADASPEACVPMPSSTVCVGPDAGILETICGPAPNGCGGSVNCGTCTPSRECARSPGDGVAGRCSCLIQAGKLCETSAGVSGTLYTCRKDDRPIDTRSEFKPQSDGSISVWCVP